MKNTRVIIDDFAQPELVRSLLATWLHPESGHWHCYENGKRTTKDADRLPTAGKVLLREIASISISSLLKLPDVFPDLEYLHGAGLHEMPAGGRLGLHLDSERHPILPWRREVSAVLYLEDVDGGELELCNEDGEILERIAVKANRLVLFRTPGLWHRVAECRSIRRSLCLFFWSLNPGGAATTATFA